MAAVAKALDLPFKNAKSSGTALTRPDAPQEPRPAAIFSQYFQIKLASSTALREQVFRLRGDVYCKEFGYESVEDCPNGLETDDYDERSLHCLIIHRKTGLPAGCVRLVPADKNQTDDLLPIEAFCGDSLIHPALHPARLPRERMTEVSRLAVHTLFRRRVGELQSPDGLSEMASFNDHERRMFPLLAAALVVAATVMSNLTGQHDNFAMMEPRLARLLQRMGLHFVQVGEVIEYHGQRAAFHITTENAIRGMQDDLLMLYNFVHQSIKDDTLLNEFRRPAIVKS